MDWVEVHSSLGQPSAGGFRGREKRVEIIAYMTLGCAVLSALHRLADLICGGGTILYPLYREEELEVQED